jgi:hypothetical protein
VIIPIPTLREYGEYLESLDRPFDLDALLAGEGLSGLNSHESLIARFEDRTRDLDVLETDDFDEIVDFETLTARRPGRRRWLIAAAAAVALLLIIGSVLVRRGEDDTKTEMPADTTDAQAVAVATGFIDAVGGLDVDRAISYLADDADISPLLRSAGATEVEGTHDALRLFFSLLRAQGYEQIVDPSEDSRRCVDDGPSDSVARLRCPFASYRLDPNELGVGLYGHSWVWVTVRDGEIVRAAMYFELHGFSAEIWRPFADWVATVHPDDVEVMYADPSQGRARLTDASIRLWERRSQEYGAAGREYVDRVRSICESARQRVHDEGATEFYDASWGRILDDALIELRALSRPQHPYTEGFDEAVAVAEQFAHDMRAGNIDVDVIHELESTPGMAACSLDGPR